MVILYEKRIWLQIYENNYNKQTEFYDAIKFNIGWSLQVTVIERIFY